jgi:hypothetical protein
MTKPGGRLPIGLRAVLSAGLIAAALTGASAAIAAGQDGFLGKIDFAPDHAKAWQLPRRLAEISGLAVTAEGRVLAHGDENGIVYELDPHEGRVLKAFAMGQPTVKDDFEDITVANGRIYLISSKGVIYETSEGENGTRVLYNTYDTGIGRRCEIEGLAYEPASGDMIIPCKTVYDPALRGRFLLYRWSLEAKGAPGAPVLSIPVSRLFGHDGPKSFRPSGIEIAPESGNYLIVDAINRLLVEMSPSGEVRGVQDLAKGEHHQAEGIAVLPGPVLLIADEGKRHGRLTLYPARAAAVAGNHK